MAFYFYLFSEDLFLPHKGQSDAYQATGCYNLLCSGFVQINNEIAMGASIFPVSRYHGSQYDISILVWKVKGNEHDWCLVKNFKLKILDSQTKYTYSNLFYKIKKLKKNLHIYTYVCNIYHVMNARLFPLNISSVY